MSPRTTDRLWAILCWTIFLVLSPIIALLYMCNRITGSVCG